MKSQGIKFLSAAAISMLLSCAPVYAQAVGDDSSSPEAAAGDEGSSTVSIVGRWDLFFDWGCVGRKYKAKWEVYDTGRFNSTSSHGHWKQNAQHITMKYYSGTRYNGRVVQDDKMRGTMISGSGAEGCWHATRYTGE